MNFNIYLNDNLVKDLETIVINTKKSRNAIIQEAVRAFIIYIIKDSELSLFKILAI